MLANQSTEADGSMSVPHSGVTQSVHLDPAPVEGAGASVDDDAVVAPSGNFS